MTIEDQTVHYLPKRIEFFFPNLKFLRITNSELKQIKKEDLRGLKELVHVGFGNNKLQVIDGGLFEDNHKLQLIDFNHNKIKNVGEELLENLKELRDVNFGNNHCTSRSFYALEQFNEFKEILKSECPSIDALRFKLCSGSSENLYKEIANLKQDNSRLQQELKSVINKNTLLTSAIGIAYKEAINDST